MQIPNTTRVIPRSDKALETLVILACVSLLLVVVGVIAVGNSRNEAVAYEQETSVERTNIEKIASNWQEKAQALQVARADTDNALLIKEKANDVYSEYLLIEQGATSAYKDATEVVQTCMEVNCF